MRTRAEILLIEDEVVVRDLLADYLRSAGYSVIGAVGYDNGVSFEKVDLVVSDLVLQNGASIRPVREIRRAYPSLRFLFLSGYTPENVSLAVDEGEFLQKPFTRSELLAKVHERLTVEALGQIPSTRCPH